MYFFLSLYIFCLIQIFTNFDFFSFCVKIRFCLVCPCWVFDDGSEHFSTVRLIPDANLNINMHRNLTMSLIWQVEKERHIV